MKNKFNFKSIILTFTLLTLGVGQMWATDYNNETHVYLNVDGTTKYYKVSTESWTCSASLPGTWGGVLKDQTFSNIHTLEIKGGGIGGWTSYGDQLSGSLSYKVTQSTSTPSSWDSFGSITSSSAYNGDNCFYYKNNGATNVTPHAAGTYYLHIKISYNSTSKTSYVKFTIPSYTVAGSETVLGSDWSVTDTNNDMTYSSGTTYTLTKSNVTLTKGNTYEYKVALNHAWGTSYPGSNASIDFGNTTGHYDVTFTFNASTKAVSATATRLYAVIYNDNGKTSGSVPATSYHANGATVTVASNSGSLAKTGYSFGGWNTNSSGTGTNYTAGSGTFTMGSSDKNLYAKWTENKSNITLVASPSGKGTFQVGGVTVTSTQAGVTTTPEVTAVPIAGYSFSGWSITGGATISSTSTNPTTVTGKGAGANATLTATFEEDLTYYDVTFGVGTSYTSLGSISATNNTTSSAISSGDDILSASNITFTATPNTGYVVEGWYTNAACTAGKHNAGSTTYTIASLSSDVTVYVKFVEKTWSVAFAAGTGGTVTTPASTPKTVGQVTGISIAATPATGYTFNSWSSSSGGSFTSGASTNSNTFKPTANTTVTASFNETMSALTTSCHYDVGNPSYANPTVSGSATTVGYATTRTITATAPGTGYTFVGWTLTHCVRTSGAANSRTITVRSDGSGEAASAVANYEEVLTSTYYVVGDKRGPFTDGWTANANTMMMKRTGYSTSSDVYWELEVPASKTSPGNDQWEFKIYNDASTTGEKWYGWGNTDNYWLTKANNNLTLSTKGSKTIYLKCYVEGTYTFHVNYSTPASPTLEVSWPVVNQLRISSANPADAGNTGNYDLVEGSDNDWSVSRNLNAGTTYTFKMVYEGDWYGKNSTNLTRASNSASALSTDGANMTIETDVAGSYTFTFNSSSKNLTVTYPTAYTITYGVGTLAGCDAVTTSPSFTSGDYVLPETDVTFSKGSTKAGYTWKGWYSNVGGTGDAWSTSDASLSLTDTRTGNISVYACYNYATYTATLSTTGRTGYGSGAPANQTATYLQAMPTITPPTATNGYCFMGYWDGEEGTGTQYYNANGTSAHAWDKTSGATLYAYFKKAEITDITLNSSVLDPVDAGGTGWVIANPTVEPTPVLPVKICWELLYDNDNPVPAGHEAEKYTEGDTKPNQVRFSIAGLAASRYKIKATLRTGSSCDGGTELSTFTQTFTIASSFTVTILYQDDDNNNIAPGTTSPGKATDWTTISAPDIFGYSFVGWTLGEGITAGDPTDQQNDFRFKASYYGTIVAQYTKNQYIYLDLSQDFSTYGKWNNPYVYFYNGDPWVDNKGAGAKDGDKTHTHYISGHSMTKIDGTDIWYFDYGGVSGATRYVAFTWGNQTMQENFNATDVIFRGDFSESTPLFVPATDGGTAESRQTDVNGAHYYNKGYWVTYLGEPTGYTLLVYNSAGDVELKREPFIAADKRMTMTSTVQLDASSNYKLEVLRNDGYYYNKATTGFTASSLGPKAIETGGSKYNIQTNADGIYTFTLNYYSGNLQLSVVYPSSIGDFRIAYTDNATWSHSHTLNSWILPSKTITHRANGIDTISFFISKGAGITPKIRWEKVTAVSESSVTWGTTGEWLTTGYTDVSEAGVYNFKVTQNADGTSIASIERIGAYDGSYYIRCNALRSKWDHYTIDSDHRMTYSEFSESAANSFGEKYSHYKAKWCPRNTNIAFVIANDYSPCITDTLKQDVGNPYGNTDTNGTLNNDGVAGHSGNNAYLDPYSANVRFMWNRKTNKISRAYVSASTSTNAKFLVLQGSGMANSNIYNGTTGYAFDANPPGANSVILSDNENWIYEVTVKANPSALVKLYANYCGKTQWFRGTSGTTFTKDVNAIELLGGSASASQYSVRVIYDFKTNRLVCAWVPSGASETISTDLTVNADVMIVREHQGSAQCITFANDKSMTGVKTVYGAMKFNRWILSNREHPEDTNPDHCRESNIEADLAEFHRILPIGQQLSIYERSLYFISFPFDVKASEIFGFGHYWDEWYLEYYDGETRAKNGYWKDSPANWKYVTPDMLEDFTLKANEGYILGLDLDFMKVNNTAFWSNGISTVELYFPSTVNLETLQQTNVTIPALSSDYKCTINRGTPEGDRRVKDSYWRCLGVPSFNIYNSALKDGSGNTIEWKTDYTWHADESEFPFIYMWNKADNTLTPQATSTFTFLPMHAYLVQNGGAIHWTAVSAKPSSIVARRVNEQPQKEYNWDLTLVCDSQLIDRTYIRMSNLEQVTDSFDFGQDLNKEFNSNRSDIYTYIGYEKVAANSMPIQTEQTTIVAVGVKINTAGEYTFAMPEGTYGADVTLIDTETGVRTHLGLMDYTVTLAKGDYTNRFILEISPVSNTPTDIELINGENGDASLNGVRKVLIDNKLFLIKGDKVYDATGRCIN